jgi:hypothetical protein
MTNYFGPKIPRGMTRNASPYSWKGRCLVWFGCSDLEIQVMNNVHIIAEKISVSEMSAQTAIISGIGQKQVN